MLEFLIFGMAEVSSSSPRVAGLDTGGSKRPQPPDAATLKNGKSPKVVSRCFGQASFAFRTRSMLPARIFRMSSSL